MNRAGFENLNIEVENRSLRRLGRFFFVMGLLSWGSILVFMVLLHATLFYDVISWGAAIFLLPLWAFLGRRPLAFVMGLVFFISAAYFGGIAIRISSILMILIGICGILRLVV